MNNSVTEAQLEAIEKQHEYIDSLDPRSPNYVGDDESDYGEEEDAEYEWWMYRRELYD